MAHKILNLLIAIVWLANGLFCKVLNIIPRHQAIVAKILGDIHARPITIAIGLAEIAMAVWILAGIRSRLNAMAQIVIIAAMNMLEFILAPELLLWGRMNAFFAFLFVLLIYCNEFYIHRRSAGKE